MNGQQIDEKITSEQLAILELVHHRTLEKTTAGAAVKRARLFFLLLPYFNGDYWPADAEASSRSVSIVQAALDAHDLVEENGAAVPEQQLTVLAGDYYSGIHYLLLAKLKNIGLIRCISAAIAEACESKAVFYKEGLLCTAEIEQAVETAENSLIFAFYRYYGFDSYSWLAGRVLSLLKYREELLLLQAGEMSKFLEVLTAATGSLLKAERWLEGKLNGLYREVLRQNEKTLTRELEQFLLDKILPDHRQVEQLIREG
ncbi:heptaprenyl diphosphate synthase component 1 [Indiicoccus explosivorum]|uniref:heptaprenyl diphosphate synthase component 1 n=1 Tax=Indiicoccus explosivorum TaxID=1917864 RepID=UPI0013900C39|nr:heptaprenyl diphosphate synthase component 1 [Indiicoccus explosivorum]